MKFCQYSKSTACTLEFEQHLHGGHDLASAWPLAADVEEVAAVPPPPATTSSVHMTRPAPLPMMSIVPFSST